MPNVKREGPVQPAHRRIQVKSSLSGQQRPWSDWVNARVSDCFFARQKGIFLAEFTFVLESKTTDSEDSDLVPYLT